MIRDSDEDDSIVTRPRAQHLARLAEALGMTVTELRDLGRQDVQKRFLAEQNRIQRKYAA